jgi:hypothetical protein
MKRVIFLMIFSSLIFNATAQQEAKKRYFANKASGSITIDGALNEEDWKSGNWEGGFIQHEPYENGNPSQKTEFRLLYDDVNIYVAIKAFDTAPDSIVRRLSRRDHTDGDYVGVMFDSYHDLRTAFSFTVSASGVKNDETITNNGEVEDLTWDPIWYVKTAKYNWGWAAEMKIPLTQLRFEKNSAEVWGFEVLRNLFRKNETDLWQPIPRNAPGFIHLFGELAGLGEIKPRKQFDLTPYLVSSLDTYQEEENNPYEDGKDTQVSGGLDGKIGVTNNLTLDFTLNPDFGQVEADPSEVNLTAFETFFIEKRPFFIEGNNITQFQLGFGDGDLSMEQLFYSRRIGRRPHSDPDLRDDEYIKSPEFTSIIGAAKLTGKSASGWSVGIIESLGAEENAKITYQGEQRKEVVEPLTNYFVGRLQKDINEGNTIIGAMVTSTDRKLENTSLEDLLHKNGRSAGFDFKQYFSEKNWLFQVNAAFSNVTGTKEAIDETQKSSTHYFQRPDATHLEYDPARTSLSGHGGNVQINKIGGRFNMMLATMWKSPGLELNDVGFLRSTDEIIEVFWCGYRFTKPKGIMRNANLNFNQWYAWDFGGTDLVAGGNVNGHIQFTNQWSAHAGVNMEGESISNSQLRGGPSMKMPGNKNIWYYITTDPRRKLSFEYNGQHSKDNNNGTYSNYFSPEINYRPLNSLQLSFDPSFMINQNDLQYVDESSYQGNSRYVLSTINQKIISFSARINFNITPDLSIQYWGQPFIASGKYSKFKITTDPKAPNYNDRFQVFTDQQLTLNDDNIYEVDENIDGTTDYSFENPNFNFNEFLSNLVLRWEYVPGSTVYLVWSQNRNYTGSSGDFDYAHNMDQLYNYEKPGNTFLIKFSYRFALH